MRSSVHTWLLPRKSPPPPAPFDWEFKPLSHEGGSQIPRYVPAGLAHACRLSPLSSSFIEMFPRKETRKHLFFKICFYCLCEWFVYAPCACSTCKGQKRALYPPRTGVTHGCEPACGCPELSLDLLKGCQCSSTTESSLQLHSDRLRD